MGLIGRQSELAAMTAALDAAGRGQGRALVVLGEPGSGKTALADEFAARARKASVRVLWMAGRAIGDAAHSWPWPAVVRELGGGAPVLDGLRAGRGGARLFEDVAALLIEAAERQPVLLVVDDSDVVDDVAVDLLVFVAEQLRLHTLTVLVTARDRRRVEHVCRAGTVIALPGLGPSAVRELLEADGVVVGDDAGAAVVRLTGGLPGEVNALARALAGGSAVTADDVFHVALDLASGLAHTDGRAAAEPLARRLVAARDLASPHVRAEVVLFVHELGGTTSTTADDRVTSIEEVLAALGDDGRAVALRAQLHAALASELYHGDVLRAGRDPATEAATGWRLAQQSGDAPTQARCLRARHDIEWRPGTATRRLALLDEIVTLLDGTARYEEMAEASLARYAAYLELGDPRADREFDRFLQMAERDPTPRLRHLMLSRRAMRALMAGDLERAEELIDAAAISARRSGEPDGVVVAMNQRCELYAERGDRSTLLPILERFRAASSHPAIAASLALARLDGGDREGAQSAVAPYEDVALTGLQPEYGRAWVLSMLGDVFVALGARDAIRRTADALLPFAGTNVVAGGGVVYRGAVDHHVGGLLVAAGDQDAGIARLRAALEMHQSLGAVRWARRTADALASVDALPAPDLPPRVAGGVAEAAMVRDGDVWTVTYAAKTFRGKDSKGLRDLAVLLANPDVEIRATTLAGTPASDTVGDDVLDPRARAEIAARLSRLDADITRADERGDQAASARAVAERDALVDELRVTTGLAGRARRLGDPAERARKAVSARLHDAILRIEARHAELGRHLHESVLLGRSCQYRPAPPCTGSSARTNLAVDLAPSVQERSRSGTAGRGGHHGRHRPQEVRLRRRGPHARQGPHRGRRPRIGEGDAHDGPARLALVGVGQARRRHRQLPRPPRRHRRRRQPARGPRRRHRAGRRAGRRVRDRARPRRLGHEQRTVRRLRIRERDRGDLRQAVVGRSRYAHAPASDPRPARKMHGSRSFGTARIACMIRVERLRAGAPAFGQVVRWHWLEWGVQDEDADEAEWRARLTTRCLEAGIPFTLVASLDGEPVGCVTVCTDDRDARYTEHGPWLSGMVVTGPARNMGVGRALLGAAAGQARAAAATDLWVWTTEAGPFYERCGYRYVHRKENVRDCSVLARTL